MKVDVEEPVGGRKPVGRAGAFLTFPSASSRASASIMSASSLAEAQSIPDLARQIQFELKFYQAGKSFSLPEHSQ